MAEETIVTNETTESQVKADESAKKATPTVDELMAKLALAEAERNKLKNANDKLSKESAEFKRQQRASMTAEEQKNAEIEEKIRELTERAEQAERENNHSKAVAAYKGLSDEDTVEKLIDAINDSDHAAIANIINEEVARAVKAAQGEWLKTRPQLASGAGSSMSKEDIMAIKDDVERHKAIAENIRLFR